jgi:hypothetical protein
MRNRASATPASARATPPAVLCRLTTIDSLPMTREARTELNATITKITRRATMMLPCSFGALWL